MLKQPHNQRECSPIAQDVPMSTLSPNSKRRAEFTIKHLQCGVMGRARSTLNTLGDVWRPKGYAGASKTEGSLKKKSSSTPSSTGKKWAAVWATRNKKPIATQVDENVSAETSSKVPNPVNFTISDSNSVLVDNTNRNKNFGKPIVDIKSVQPVTEAAAQVPQRKRRSNTIAINHPKQYSRNNSLDLAVLLASNKIICNNDMSDDELRIAEMTDTSRSRFSYENYNYLSHRLRRKSFVDAWEPLVQYVHSPAPVKESENAVKPKMRLVSDGDADDMVVRRSNRSTKQGILFRHSSVEPIGNGKFLSTSRQSGTEEHSASDEHGDENNLIAPQRPRKKLSFREPPVEIGAKFMNLKSDTLPRAKKFLKEYEEKRSGSLDYELEVKFSRGTYNVPIHCLLFEL